MIARADGQVVLVSGAIPGERAEVRIERIGKGVAFGQAVAIDLPSPDRRVPGGDPACGGCLYAHIAYPRQLELKAQVIADALGRIGRIVWAPAIRVASSPELGYRMRARLHVRDARIGFFREGTHALCDARPLGQLLPETCDVLDRIAGALAAGSVHGSGDVELSENIDASGRAVHLDIDAPFDPRALAASIGAAGLTGLSIARPGRGEPPTVAIGDPHVDDVLEVDGHQVVLRRHVLSFFQGNRFLLGDLAALVVGHVAEGDDVVDLYAGVGLFAVAAAVARRARVTAVEGDSRSAADLRGNVATLGGVVRAVHEPVEDFTAHHRRPPAVLIADPPRTGMSKPALAGVLALAARQIVYVSCDAATLARDARVLLDAGYRIGRIDAFDLFPNTPHVETVVTFDAR